MRGGSHSARPRRLWLRASGTDLALLGSVTLSRTRQEIQMLYYALVFLVIALVAGALGLSGVAGVSANIAWILFIVGLVVAAMFFLRGRRPPPI